MYRSAETTPASGLFGPNLLPRSASGRFRIVVCADCGLTQFFASTLDSRSLKHNPGWERIGDARGPLGLKQEADV
jgi:hypothetical protein